MFLLYSYYIHTQHALPDTQHRWPIHHISKEIPSSSWSIAILAQAVLDQLFPHRDFRLGVEYNPGFSQEFGHAHVDGSQHRQFPINLYTHNSMVTTTGSQYHKMKLLNNRKQKLVLTWKFGPHGPNFLFNFLVSDEPAVPPKPTRAHRGGERREHPHPYPWQGGGGVSMDPLWSGVFLVIWRGGRRPPPWARKT